MAARCSGRDGRHRGLRVSHCAKQKFWSEHVSLTRFPTVFSRIEPPNDHPGPVVPGLKEEPHDERRHGRRVLTPMARGGLLHRKSPPKIPS